VDAVSSDTAVSMEPAPGIAFELAGTAPALPANVRLIVCVEEDRSAPPVECELVREHGASTHYFPEGALALLGYGLASLPLEGRRTESWPVRTAGTRELRVLLRLSVEGQRPKTAKVSVRPTEVDLGACTDGQMVTLHIEDGAIERALGEVWN